MTAGSGEYATARIGSVAAALRAPVTLRTWLATTHVLVGAPMGLLTAGLLVLGGAFTAGLAVLPLTWVFTRWQRARFAAYLGVWIQVRPWPAKGDRWGRWILREMFAAHTWRQVGYHLVAGILGFVAAVAVLGRGTIRVDDVDGELRLSTGAGDVEIHNALGRIRVRTDGGMITATGLRSVEADARTAYGDVSLDFVVPPALARASTDFGDVEVALPRGDDAGTTYQVRVVAPKSVGFIDVPSDPSSPNQVFATVPYGDVYIRYSSG